MDSELGSNVKRNLNDLLEDRLKVLIVFFGSIFPLGLVGKIGRRGLKGPHNFLVRTGESESLSSTKGSSLSWSGSKESELSSNDFSQISDGSRQSLIKLPCVFCLTTFIIMIINV